MENDLKGQLIHSYLNQQLSSIGPSASGPSGGDSTAVQAMELPDNAVLEEFKQQVRMWIELDNQVQKLQQAIKERKQVKNQLTEKILRFMGRYNIEDLNTKEGKLRYRATPVKTTVSKTEIKRRLVEHYGKVNDIDELTELVFKSQETDEKKATLRRLRGN